MQLRKILASVFILAGFLAASCEKILGPDKDNHSTTGRLYTDPAFAEGLLLNGYTGWPNNYGLDEIATDDAVTNSKGNTLQRMATGEWSALFTPISVWSSAYQRIYYLNYFLSIVDDVNFAWDDRTGSSDARDVLFRQRYTGEAKILRAWYNFELLKNHGGTGDDGNPYGFIIMNSVPDRNADFNRPRNSYQECVDFIMEDLNEGIRLLPNIYADKAGDAVYNAVFGNVSGKNNNRINGRFAKALKSRVALYVASQPIYNAEAKWDSAAVAAARLLRTSGGGINGVAGMSNTGRNFWQTSNDAEIIFRRDYFNANSREQNNFPPSRFGSGQTNPSQNLVDAFPMLNGYPINHPSANYSPQNPYANRDPRLKMYIVYNGNDLNNTIVNTTLQDAKDGVNQTINSTRTGYYLKKLLQPNVNLTPTVMSTQRNFYTLFRYTEIFLNYAEAANEAWGPNADPMGYGFTPRSIIARIRTRAGIPAADPYLASITDKEGMRQLIRNERRLELCFEGFRFWDMRRWGLDLTEQVKGISIDNGVHTVFDVEQRAYQPHMKYGPIPYQEVLKNNLTVQNQGW